MDKEERLDMQISGLQALMSQDEPKFTDKWFPYAPVFVQDMKKEGVSQEFINRVMHDNIVDIFRIPKGLIPNTERVGRQSKKELNELAREYAWNPYTGEIYR